MFSSTLQGRIPSLRTATILNPSALSTRQLSTKGHKKTRKIEARKLEILKSTTPRLPWYLHKEPPKRLTRFFADRENLLAIKESAEVVYKLLREQPERIPIGAVVKKLKYRRQLADRERWAEKQLPRLRRHIRAAVSAVSPPSEHVVVEDKGNSSPERVESASLTDVVDTDDRFPAIDSVEDSTKRAPIQAAVEVELKDDLRLSETDAKETLINIKVKELLEIEWVKELERRRTEPSSELEKRLEQYKTEDKVPPAELGVRLMKAYDREKDVGKAWKTFLEFTGKMSLWTPALVEAGIKICGHRNKPERALNLFEMAEIQFGRASIPQFYHPTMRACAGTRGTTQVTFDLFDRMTKVEFLKPNAETLSIVLKACSTLGDVGRAEQFWQEMVGSGEVIPTEECVVGMLNCYATGNRMLRAKTLKKDSIKVLTFEDKARLALAGGFTPPKVDRTDEASLLIRELDGLDPSEIIARYGMDQVDDWDMEEDQDEENESFEDDDANDADVIAAKREFEEEQKEGMKTMTEDMAESQSNEHVTFIPGISPSSLSPITKASYQKTFDTLAALDAREQNEPAIGLTKVDSHDSRAVVARDESSSGRRQESNIARSRVIVTEAIEKHDLPLTARLLNAQLRVTAEALRLHRATLFLQTFQEHNLQPNLMTFNVLINMFSRAQRVERAKEMFEIAMKAGAVDKLTVGPMVDGLARTGRVNEAFQLYQEYKDLELLERHLRCLRIKLNGDTRMRQLPADPNAWRSRENISKQMRAIGRDPGARKVQNWLLSVARN